MNAKSLRLGATLALLTIFAPTARASSVLIDSTNAASPLYDGFWSAVDVGFVYTPSLSYTLDGIATKFGTNDVNFPPSGPVTVAIFAGVPMYAQGDPNVLPGSLTFLRSGQAIPVENSFVTASFSPVTLTAGSPYFVAFENVRGYGANITFAASITFGYWYDYGGLTLDGFTGDGYAAQVGLGVVSEFFGPAPTPLPGAFSLFATGLGALGLLGWRRKRKSASVSSVWFADRRFVTALLKLHTVCTVR